MIDRVEIAKADVAVARERSQGAIAITVFFEVGGSEQQTELDPGETVTAAFPDNLADSYGFEKFIRVESDKAQWASLGNVLGFDT